MNEILIRAEALWKRFGGVAAVDGVSLQVRAGEIYGLVGSDGAGKTTTLRLLIGAIKPEAGNAFLGGFRLDRQADKARAVTGYLSQRFSLYEDLTVLENIRFFAEVRGMRQNEWYPRCMEILEFVGLAQFRQRRAGQLSGGMKQKLGLASALVTRPRVLLLDEPTTGVDPVTRQDFWQLIIRLAASHDDGEGIGVLVTTPYMDEAVRCHRIGFMRKGRLIAEGTPAALRERFKDTILELQGSPLAWLKELAASHPLVKDVRSFGDRLHLRLAEGDASAATVSLEMEKAVWAGGGEFKGAKAVPPTLEDVFMALAEAEE